MRSKMDKSMYLCECRSIIHKVMSSRYIQKIQVNKVFHLGGFAIPIDRDDCPHLMITGKNGSGKTSLLSAMADFIEKVRWDAHKSAFKYEDNLKFWENKLLDIVDDNNEFLQIKHYIQQSIEAIENVFGRVKLSFASVDALIEQSISGDFVVAYYQATRKVQMQEPKNPTKPSMQEAWKTEDKATIQFLNFLSDLKIQEALARNERLVADADAIRDWFEGFERLLQQIFQDEHLALDFNYKDYSFVINTDGKVFKFTEMSDGFAAVLDIVVDLILKMQTKGRLASAYEKRGIVLIDEVETHLHLELQKMIMPLLTRVFPNIQFIITTHSPFVLSSLSNAVAFDLEHQEVITELNEYSYEALAEGYFGVATDSSYLEMQLERLEGLVSKNVRDVAEEQDLHRLISDFERIPEVVSPNIIGRYLDIKRKYSDLFKLLNGDD